jgi:hypothetical protein
MGRRKGVLFPKNKTDFQGTDRPGQGYCHHHSDVCYSICLLRGFFPAPLSRQIDRKDTAIVIPMCLILFSHRETHRIVTLNDFADLKQVDRQ